MELVDVSHDGVGFAGAGLAVGEDAAVISLGGASGTYRLEWTASCPIMR